VLRCANDIPRVLPDLPPKRDHELLVVRRQFGLQMLKKEKGGPCTTLLQRVILNAVVNDGCLKNTDNLQITLLEAVRVANVVELSFHVFSLSKEHTLWSYSV